MLGPKLNIIDLDLRVRLQVHARSILEAPFTQELSTRDLSICNCSPVLRNCVIIGYVGR